jgi:hypothetical protein
MHKSHRAFKDPVSVLIATVQQANNIIPFPYYAMGLQTAKMVRKRRLDSQKAKRQQQDRRKECLIKKAYEYPFAGHTRLISVLALG